MSYLSHEISLERLCRGCMGTKFLTPIFEGEDDIPRKFFEKTSIKVAEGDGLPEFLCEECMRSVLHSGKSLKAYQFKQECLRVDSVLKSKLCDTKPEYKMDANNFMDVKSDEEANIDDLNASSNTIFVSNLEMKSDSDDESVVSDPLSNCTSSRNSHNSRNSRNSRHKEDVKETINAKVEDSESAISEESVDSEDEIPLIDTKSTLVACSLCPNKYLSHLMDEHMKTEHERYITSCKICGKPFFNGFNCRQHEMKHKERKTYECSVCNEKFRKKRLLNDHARTCGKKKKSKRKKLKKKNKEKSDDYKCKDESDVVVNEEVVVDKHRFRCSYCYETFIRQHLLDVHNRMCRKKNFPGEDIVEGAAVADKEVTCFKCQFCYERFSKKQMRDAHYHTCKRKVHLPEDRDKLKIKKMLIELNREFKSRYLLKKSENPPKPRSQSDRLKCEFCEEMFSIRHFLNIHQRMCKRKNSIPGKKINSKSDDEIEFIDTGDDTDEIDTELDSDSDSGLDNALGEKIGVVQKPVIKPKVVIDERCPVCGELTPTRKEKYAHNGYHKRERLRAEKKFECKTCGKCCGSKATLNDHVKVHTNERPYKCPSCSMSFKTSTHLKGHQLVHTKDRKFVCSHCDKAFALKSNLITHMRIHTGERPYACDECPKAFMDPKALKTHVKASHNEMSD